MIKLHPEFLTKDGQRQFAVLPYDEFLAVQERLADAEELLELREAKREEADAPTLPMSEIKQQLGLT
jgi:hypothetical protein